MTTKTMRILHNAVFNLAGGVLPALVALATIPFIVRGLGDSGYGVFTLVTSIVGYFALLDINVTAGSVKYVSEFHSTGNTKKLNGTISFGLIVYSVIGVVGAVVLYFSAGYLAREVFSVPEPLHDMAETSLRIGAVGFMFGQIQTYLQSVPQALMRYDVSSRFEIFFGVLVPLATVALLWLGYGLVEVIYLRVLISVINCSLLWRAIRRLLPELELTKEFSEVARQLLVFSSYSFLSRVAALTYTHADKLIIGALVGMRELAYYTVAATLANRILGMSFRLSGVLFPTASALSAHGRIDELRALYVKSSRYVIFLNASVLVFIAVFAYPILYYWIGADFAAKGATILAIVACAQFIDSMTNIPSLVNDGLGHPHVTGGFAISRALIGLCAVYAGVLVYGIEGAAMGHLVSALLLTIAFLGYVHGRTVPCELSVLLTRSYLVPLSGVVVLALLTFAVTNYVGLHPWALLSIASVAVSIIAAYGYWVVLVPEDRARVLLRVQKLNFRRG
ncbi:flippase [Methyloversatilis sp.]|uniref:flippase n=1 Tax=Methyloversatilis sp. TaxID=2569862 RepID=UPI003F71D580